MRQIKNEVLRDIVEGLDDNIMVGDDVTSCLDNDIVSGYIPHIVAELTAFLSGGADIKWYELIQKACGRDKDQELWVRALADAYRSGCSEVEAERFYSETADLKGFRKLVEENMENGKTECSVNLTEEAMDIVEEYMDFQTRKSVINRDTDCADGLVALSVKVRDRLKEYRENIENMETVTASQKQLIESQRNKIRDQESIIGELGRKNEALETRLSKIYEKFREMSSPLHCLESMSNGQENL